MRGGRKEASDKRKEWRVKRQEAGEKRQVTREKSGGSRDKRQEAGEKRWETRGRGQADHVQGVFFLTGTPVNFLRTRSHVNWLGISLSARDCKGICT